MKQLTEKDVVITVECLAEMTPIKGNAMASGNDKLDRKVEAKVLRDLDKGNPWAWCTVKVTAEYEDYSASNYLGCCSYNNRYDFITNSGYYGDMRDEAIKELNRIISERSYKGTAKQHVRA